MILLASCIKPNEYKGFTWEYSGEWKMKMIGLASSDESWELHGWDMDLLGYVNGVLPRSRVAGEVVAVLDAGFRNDRGWQIYDVFDGSLKCHDHGSHVAGIVEYLSPGSIICIRVTDGINFDMSVVAEGIRLAVDIGATVINMSFGGGLADPLGGPLYSAIKYAFDKGVILVASSGNNGKLVFPAAYPEVIAVGSLSDKGSKSTFSALGDTWGYGENVDSLVCSGRGLKTGTSMASPMIAALLASGVDASELWLAGFGVPFADPGDWYIANDNGYDVEIAKVIDGKVLLASKPGNMFAFRDDDSNKVPSPGDLYGVVLRDASFLSAVCGRLVE